MERGKPYKSLKNTKKKSFNYNKHKNIKIINNYERYPKSILKFNQERWLNPTLTWEVKQPQLLVCV